MDQDDRISRLRPQIIGIVAVTIFASFLGIFVTMFRTEAIQKRTNDYYGVDYIYYYTGDSPIDANGDFAVFDVPLTGGQWFIKHQSTPLYKNKTDHYIWYAIKFPLNMYASNVSFATNGANVEVYFDRQKVYTYGSLEDPVPEQGRYFHTFDIPLSPKVPVIYVRAAYHDSMRYQDIAEVMVGGYEKVGLSILARGLLFYLVSFGYFAFSVGLILTYFITGKRGEAVLILGYLALAMTLVMFARANASIPAFIGSTLLVEKIQIFAILGAIALLAYFIYLLDDAHKLIQLSITIAAAVCVVAGVVLDLVGYSFIVTWVMLPLLFVVLLVSTVFFLYVQVREKRRGYLYLLGGFAVWWVFTIIEVINSMSYTAVLGDIIMPFGFLAFIFAINRYASIGYKDKYHENQEEQAIVTRESDVVKFFFEALDVIFDKVTILDVQQAVLMQMERFFLKFNARRSKGISMFMALVQENGSIVITDAKGRYTKYIGVDVDKLKGFEHVIEMLNQDNVGSNCRNTNGNHELFITNGGKLSTYIYVYDVGTLDPTSIPMFKSFAINASAAIDALILQNNSAQLQTDAIYALAEITEMRSQEAGVHVRHVAAYTQLLAELAGLSKTEAEQVAIASSLHDIGKLNIPDEILNKPGRLTDEEFEIVKRHTTDGYKLLSENTSGLMDSAAIIALQHHEKFDGTGYMGLAGDNIHLYARIVAIADVFDSLSAKRVYREAWDFDKITAHLTEQKGRHFDPVLVDLFLSDMDKVEEIYGS